MRILIDMTLRATASRTFCKKNKNAQQHRRIVNHQKEEKEIAEWRNEVLHDILDEFSRGKYIETEKFAEFLLEYNNRPEYVSHAEKTEDDGLQDGKSSRKKEIEDEKQKNKEEQLEKLMQKLTPGKKNMTLLECMNYILGEIDVNQNEKDIIEAFEIFDKYRHSEIAVGTLPLSDIKYVMEQMGPLGHQLNEYEQSKFWRFLKDDLEYVQTEDLDIPPVEIIEYVNGNRQVNLVKDKEIDYIGLTKKLLASIEQKESQFREMKTKEEETRSTIITIPS